MPRSELYAEVGLIILYEYDGKQFMAILLKWFSINTYPQPEKGERRFTLPTASGGDDRNGARMLAGARSARRCAGGRVRANKRS